MAYDRGLADRVRVLLHAQPGLTEQKMFGGLAFLINGRMCCCVMKSDLLVRLDPEQLAAELKRPHTRRLNMAGRKVKSLIAVDLHGTDQDADLEAWVRMGVACAISLPARKS